jgi:protein-S-isoprenylcysteine O-methyltransferase Ste14
LTRREQEAPPSDAEIDRLRAERGGRLWRIIRWIHKRRPILTAVLVIAALWHTLATDARPVDLLEPTADPLAVLAWLLMIIGVAVRTWGSGNLRKNQEVTSGGIYAVVRHPLYTGSLAFFLAYFLTVGDPGLGVALFLALVILVYYPTMFGEEEYLALKFPAAASARTSIPRLLPDVRRLGEAVRTDRFSLDAARANLGLRSLWFLVFLPLFLKLLLELESRS